MYFDLGALRSVSTTGSTIAVVLVSSSQSKGQVGVPGGPRAFKGTHAQGNLAQGQWFRSKQIYTKRTPREVPGRTRCNTCIQIHNVALPRTNSEIVHWNRPLQFHSLAGRSLAASTQLNFCRLFPRCSPHGTPALLEDLDRRLRLVGRGGGEAAARSAESGHETKASATLPRASPAATSD